MHMHVQGACQAATSRLVSYRHTASHLERIGRRACRRGALARVAQAQLADLALHARILRETVAFASLVPLSACMCCLSTPGRRH